MKKISLAAVTMLCWNAYAWPTINDVKVTPLSPWGGVVSYSVGGSLPDNASSYKAFVVIIDATTATEVEANVMMGNRELKLGEHQLWWNGPAFELGNYTVKIKYDPMCLHGEISHQYVQGATLAATCSTPQTTTYKCSVCGQTKNETSGSALGHSYHYESSGSRGDIHWDRYVCSRCGSPYCHYN